MKIDSYNIEQLSTSQFHRLEKSRVSVEIQQSQIEQDFLDISDEGMALSEVEEEDMFALSDEDKRKIELLETFISWLTGKEFKFSKIYNNGKKGMQEKNIEKGMHRKNIAKENESSRPTGLAMRIHTINEIHEKERMSFASSGIVKTSDGREINFSYNLNMSRETYERSEVLLEIGKFHDPLVLNFDGKGVDFDDKEIKIDIDLDGELDNINMLAKGSGFLALDLNNNGVVDDGLELFGPQTNDGFGELKLHDLDNNMWIDENDSIFNSLKIWMIDENKVESLIGLKDAGVGAIYLGNVSSQFTISNANGSLAKISGSSIYLSEDGDVNSIHEIDLKI